MQKMSSGNKMNDEKYMKYALKEAERAFLKNETPIGAVIVYQDKIIARGYNQRETLQDTTAHAEINAIKKACKKLGSWRLEDCTLYVTLEPCFMCAGAILQSRCKRVVFGATNKRFRTDKIFELPFNHQVEVIGGVLEEECAKLLSIFFSELRNRS